MNCLDPITHTLTGVFLSRAGLNRISAKAVAILAIAANLPDVDIVTAAGGALSYFHWHRHLTHSLAAAPVLSAVLAFGFYRLGAVPFVPAFAVALCGVLSHLLLDLTNAYGVRLLLPFDGAWLHWDLTPVIDYWIWAALAVGVAGPFLSRLVGSEMGEKRQGPGRGFAVAALLSLLLYDGGRAFLHARALSLLDSREFLGAVPLRVAAFPNSMNPLRWQGMAETGQSYEIYEIQLPNGFYASQGETIGKAEGSPENTAAIEAVGGTEAFRAMRDFAQYPVYRVIPLGDLGGRQVELTDVRFAFTSQGLLDRSGKVERSTFRFGRF